jgi:hypothetical protein
MEGLGKKIKNGLMYTAFLAGIGLGKEGLEKLNSPTKPDSKKNQTTINVPVRDVITNDAVSNVSLGSTETVYLFEDEDGSYIDPREQTKSEPEKLWLLNFFKSETYRKKAHAEGLTDKDIQERIKRLENTPIFKRDVEHFPDGSDGYTSLGDYNGKPMPTISIATTNTEKVPSTVIHEGEHAATHGNSRLSKRAKALYEESFNEDNIYSSNKKYESYLREYTERDARKRELEFEAEKLGIIKAGQKITEDDYKKIIKAYEEGKFEYGANQFIETTKPEYFIKVMNEVADNQEIQNHNDVPPYNLPTEQQG